MIPDFDFQSFYRYLRQVKRDIKESKNQQQTENKKYKREKKYKKNKNSIKRYN
jgi:hypothetical protein